jgi:hypothetical protein
MRDPNPTRPPPDALIALRRTAVIDPEMMHISFGSWGIERIGKVSRAGGHGEDAPVMRGDSATLPPDDVLRAIRWPRRLQQQTQGAGQRGQGGPLWFLRRFS